MTAIGVTYLRWLTDAGLDVRQAPNQLEFRFAAGADQFATIATLRAARRVWVRVAQECGAAEHGAQRPGDILRTTVACFAAWPVAPAR